MACIDLMWGVYFLALVGAAVIVAMVVMAIHQAQKGD